MRYRLATTTFLTLAALVLLVPGYGAAQAPAEDNPRFISFDEVAPETDPEHNSDPAADLTYTYGWVAGDTLVIELDFSSDWGEIHLMVALERNRDPDGGSGDPFEFPVAYGHENRPDFVFTYKYSASDYADLRRWNAGALLRQRVG